MEATRTRATAPAPGLAEVDATRVWTEQRLRALTRAAFVGGGYDPDAFDAALLAHRACAVAVRRAQSGRPAPAA